MWVREGTRASGFSDCESWTLARSFAHTVRLARYLRELGISPGSRIAVIGKNSPWHLVAYAAAAALQGVTVPVSWQFPVEELAGVMNHCEPKVVLVDSRFLSPVRTALVALDVPPVAVLTFDQVAQLCLVPEDETLPALDLALRAERELGEIPCCTDTTPGAIIYTSGTSDVPKGTLLTYRNLWWGCLNFREAFEYSPRCTEAVVAPMSHIGGFNGTTTDLFTTGGTVVIFEKFDPVAVLEAIGWFGINMMFAVPAMYRLLADTAEAGSFDTSTFTRALVGGAAWDLHLAKRLIALGWGPINIWGMTEQSAAGACLTTEVMTGREVAVGRAFPHTELRITDNAGQPVPPNTIGQIECRGPSVVSQYFRDPALTAATIDAQTGWLKTGDLGCFDTSGFLHLAGRITDTINSGGEKIFAAKVERVLCAHPSVAGISVLGLPDEVWGEILGAVVALQPGMTSPTLEELRRFGAAHLAPYELPRLLRVVDSLPLNANGKPDRKALSRLLAQSGS